MKTVHVLELAVVAMMGPCESLGPGCTPLFGTSASSVSSSGTGSTETSDGNGQEGTQTVSLGAITEPAGTSDLFGLVNTLGQPTAVTDTHETEGKESSEGSPAGTTYGITDGESAGSPLCDSPGPLLAGAPADSRSSIADAALFPNGDLAITGAYIGDLELGDLPVNNSGSWKTFVARIRCDGSVVWARITLPCNGAVFPTSVAVTQSGSGVAVGGFDLGFNKPFLDWRDEQGEPKDPDTWCFGAFSLAHDLAPLGQDSVAFSMSQEIAVFSGPTPEVTIQPSFGQPVALAADDEAGIFAVEIDSGGDLRVQQYTTTLKHTGDLGLLVGPVRVPTAMDMTDYNPTAITRQETGRIAVGVLGDGDVAVLVNDVPQNILSGCDEESLIVEIDTSPTVYTSSNCLNNIPPIHPIHILSLHYSQQGELLIGGSTVNLPRRPVFSVGSLPAQFVVPELVGLSQNLSSRGQVSQIFPKGGGWLVTGGYPSQAMSLGGEMFMSGGTAENLFLGVINPL